MSSIVNFAMIANNKVFYILSFNEDFSLSEKWIAALRSNVKLINKNKYEAILKGSFYKNENFYLPEDTNFENPIAEIEYDDSSFIGFAGIMDDRVIGHITFLKEDMTDEQYELIKSGMSTNPTYKEVSDNVQVGWIFDGTNFINPEV